MNRDVIPDVPDWVPLERYGIGIPAALAALGLAVLRAAAPGLGMWASLTPYGRLGLGLVLAVSVAFFVAAGYTYAGIDTTWWLKTEDDAEHPVTTRQQEVEFEDTGE